MATNEAQRDLDLLSTYRLKNLPTPANANEATVTDNSTAPANPSDTAQSGSSFLAAPINHVHQAVHSMKASGQAQLYGDVIIAGSNVTQSGQTITIGAGPDTNKLEWGDSDQTSVTGTSEEIVREFVCNMSDLSAGTIQARLQGIVKVGGGTGTFKLYVGATTPGATTGGTVRATITTTNTSFETQTNLGSSFTNPNGQVIVQLTAVNSTAATKSTIRGWTFTLG